jgi:tellurite resistance protein
MGSVAHRIAVLVELFMGAVFADGKCDNRERDYVRALVADLLCKSSLPPEVEILIDQFDPERFDLRKAADDFSSDPPMNKRRVMELVAYVTLSDGPQTIQEDGYLLQLGHALGMRPEEFRHLTSDPDMAAMRESFTDLARVPLRHSRW